MALDNRIGIRSKDKDGEMVVTWPALTICGRTYQRGPQPDGRPSPQPMTINLDPHHFIVVDLSPDPGYKDIVEDLRKKVKGMADAPKRTRQNDDAS